MGRPTSSLVGQRFGSLTVIERAENPDNRQAKWLCRCEECGGTYIAYGLNLKSCRITSCGCKRLESNLGQTSASIDYLRKNVSDPYQNLANAIVAVAVDDYRVVLEEKLMARLERFFHLGWYKTLTNVNADILIGMLQKERCRNLNIGVNKRLVGRG